jgi:predicted amidophosphoribosyltransferase
MNICKKMLISFWIIKPKSMTLQRTSIRYKYYGYPHFYLCSYLPLSARKDRLSLSLLKFKHGLQPDLDVWIDCAQKELDSLPWQPDTLILRALRHDETTFAPSHPTPLDLLGQALATRFHCHYQPGLLRKSRPTRPCKDLPRYQRMAELQDTYIFTPPSLIHISPSPPSTSSPILLIDDILTTGTTLRTIIRAIREHCPDSPLLAFTLAKANYNYNSTPNYPIPPQIQNYQPGQDIASTLAEDEQEYEPDYAKSTHPIQDPLYSYFNRPDPYRNRPDPPDPESTPPAPENFSNTKKLPCSSAEDLQKWILANSF